MAPLTVSENATYMIYCKMTDSSGNVYCIAVQDGKLVLAPPNMGNQSQIWEKEDTGNGNFMLVSTSTNEVVKFYGKGDQLTMVSKPQNVDKSVLWGQGQQDYDGYACITAPALLDMVMDAWNGDIHNGTVISIFTKDNPERNNQLWKLTPI